jgi:hypothetical protein
MKGADYGAALTDTLSKPGAIRRQIEGLEVEAAKLRQFFAATLNMLPDPQKSECLAASEASAMAIGASGN